MENLTPIKLPPITPFPPSPEECRELLRGSARIMTAMREMTAQVRTTHPEAVDTYTEEYYTDQEARYNWLADQIVELFADSTRTPSDLLIEVSAEERVAEAIYNAMRENDPKGQRYPWVPGGNSQKQDTARRQARAALIAVRADG